MSEELSDRQKRRNRKSVVIQIVNAKAVKRKRVSSPHILHDSEGCVKMCRSTANWLKFSEASDNDNSSVTSLWEENEEDCIFIVIVYSLYIIVYSLLLYIHCIFIVIVIVIVYSLLLLLNYCIFIVIHCYCYL